MNGSETVGGDSEKYFYTDTVRIVADYSAAALSAVMLVAVRPVWSGRMDLHPGLFFRPGRFGNRGLQAVFDRDAQTEEGKAGKEKSVI